MNLIVSTCGTSTLTNLADKPTRKVVKEYANASSFDHVPIEARSVLLRLIDQAKMKIMAADIPSTKLASAELNGVLCLARGRTPLPAADVHILLHTDTCLGTATAEIVADKLRTYGATPQLQKVESLSTKSREQFDEGLRNLVEWAADALPGYHKAKYDVIFNLVGGFKSVQGFMQTLGMFYADDIIYIFESGHELLRIPRLPIDLNSAAQSIMTEHASLFRRLDVLGPQSISSVGVKDVPQTLLYSLGDEVELAPWSKLLWNAYKPKLYTKKLLDSPSECIRYAAGFCKDARDLPADRLATLNERIDDLMRRLEAPNRPNPRRLDLKPLRGDPKPPATHEIDAWADADCRRIFLSFENQIAILHRVTQALH